MIFNHYYTNGRLKGKPAKIPLVDLPAGTLLFRAMRIIDEKSLFMDFLGIPTEDGFCMRSTQNIFTFPFPFVGLGIMDWLQDKPAWHKYNAILVYVLAESQPFINLINPSTLFRASPITYFGVSDSIQRCHRFKSTECDSKISKYNLGFDNCVNRDFGKKLGIFGSIAIAKSDSLKRDNPAASPMGQYLKLLYEKYPTEALTIMKHFYLDSNNTWGIPEIAIYGRKEVLPVPERKAKTVEEISALFTEDLLEGQFNVLPIATIVANGIFYQGSPQIDIQEGLPAEERKKGLEENMHQFMEQARTTGISNYGKMKYDMRTGFYVFEDLAPKEIKRLLVSLKNDDDIEKTNNYATLYRMPISKSEFLKKADIPGFFKVFLFEHPDYNVILSDIVAAGTQPLQGGGQRRQRLNRTIKKLKKTNKTMKVRHVNTNSTDMPIMNAWLPTAPEPVTKKALDAVSSFSKIMNNYDLKTIIVNNEKKRQSSFSKNR
jgi:hypothetical protein